MSIQDLDFDLETFVDLFDTAISSENVAVQKALRNLMLIATLSQVHKELDSSNRHPLRNLLNEIDHANTQIRELKHDVRQLKEHVFERTTSDQAALYTIRHPTYWGNQPGAVSNTGVASSIDQLNILPSGGTTFK